MNRFEYQNLASAKLVSYDLETCDPYLKEDGPGWARGVGYVLGCAIAVKDFKTYVPLGESPKEENVRWLKDLLGRASYKTGANLQYDMGWLSELGIYPGGVNLDVQFAEALLDDVMLDDFGKRRSYSLDSLAEHYLGEHKASSAIEKYNKEHWPYSKEPRENLWRMPEKLVAEYAVQDAALPLRIITSQWRELQREGLLDVFLMECKLLPILVQMRRRGLNVDSEKAQETRDEMLTAQHIMQDMLNNVIGAPINVNSGKDLASVFEANGVSYPRTTKGNPSFTAPFLKSCDAPIAKQVLELRQLVKARSTFVENAILGKMVNNKIYPSLHPLRTDEGGTISGRFSSSQPNCFSADTELLTDIGWVNVADITLQNNLAQMSIDAGQLSWAKPTALHAGVAHQLYTYESTKISMSVTEEHNCLLQDMRTKKRRLIKAKDFIPKKGNDAYLRAGGLPLGEVVNTARLKLAVAISADGSKRKDSDTIRFGFTKPRKAIRLAELLAAVDIDARVYLNKHVYMCSFIAPSWLWEWLHKDGTRFTDRILRCDYQARDTFIQEIVLWDGHTRKNEKYAKSYFSVHKANADLVQAVACITDYCGVCTYRSTPNDWNADGGYWYVTLQKDKNHVYVERSERTVQSGTVTVYCVTMPQHTVVSRRNGKVCFSGQSQQFPKRNAQWAPIIRGMFVPEAGHTHWASMDLSQIEYRLFAHFANDPDLIAAYADPHTDFHAAIVELVGGNIPRIACKTLNFGLLYGMGKTKLTAQLSGFFPDEVNPNRRAAEVYDTYQSKFPAASKLLKDCATEVSNPPHFIRTILGRKSRFKLWEANSFTRTKALPIGSARSQYGSNLRIAESYKAVNRLLQGSAADMMKKAMVDAHSSGLFEKMGYPHLTIHDELCFSYHRDLHQYFEELKGTVENAVSLRVPVVLGLETGPDWGHLTAQECQARS